MLPHQCTSDELLRRLHKVEGQVRGLGRMVERSEPHLAVLTQLAAARGALDAVAVALVANAIDENGGDDAQRDATVEAVARLVRL